MIDRSLGAVINSAHLRQLRTTTAFLRQALELRFATLLGRKDLPSVAEIAALRPAQRVLILGLVGWIGLVALVLVAALISTHLSRYYPPGWPGADRHAARTAGGRVMLTFDNIVQRPLFARSRQAVTAPVAVVQDAPTPQPAMLDQSMTLKGVFMNEGVSKAFLLSAGNPVGVWVPVDGEINGWRVIGIRPNEVELDGQNQHLILPLTVGSGK